MFPAVTVAWAAISILPTSLAQPVTITDQIPGAFIDISATGEPLALGDEGVAEISTDIDLTQTLFAGDGTGRLWVSNNGAVAFLGDGGSVGASWLNAAIPSFSLFGGAHGTPQALAVYWDDLDSDTGEIYYETVGPADARVLVVQWQDRPHYSGDPVLDGNEVTFQLQVFENAAPGHAQFIYTDLDFQDPDLDNGASATVGYQGNGIATDVQWSFNEPGAVQAGVILTLNDACPGCPESGDLNCDSLVDAADLALLLGSWGPCVACVADLNGDEAVNAADLAILLGHWGQCP